MQFFKWWGVKEEIERKGGAEQERGERGRGRERDQDFHTSFFVKDLAQKLSLPGSAPSHSSLSLLPLVLFSVHMENSWSPSSWCQPLTYWKTSNGLPLSLLFSGLNNPSAFTFSSQIFFSNPLILSVFPGKNSKKYFDYLVRSDGEVRRKLTF